MEVNASAMQNQANTQNKFADTNNNQEQNLYPSAEVKIN